MSTVRGPLENPERRNRNLQWLRQHFRSLGEVGRLPFSNADLWQLHQYYFSPPVSATEESSIAGVAASASDDGQHSSSRSPFSSASPTSCDDSACGAGGASSDRPMARKVVAPPPTPAFGVSSAHPPLHHPEQHGEEPRAMGVGMGMGRAVSFQALGDAFAASGLSSSGAAHSHVTGPASFSSRRRSSRHRGGGRRSHDELEEDDDNCGGAGAASASGDKEPHDEGSPALKRAKGVGKPRIAYYPRVMAKLQGLGTKPMDQSLSLLRQLKYCENAIFSGRDPYAAATGPPLSPSSGAGAGGSPWSAASTMAASYSSTASSVRARRGSEDDNHMDRDDDGGGGGNHADLLSHADVEMILLDLL